jgi:hypothetical protein
VRKATRLLAGLALALPAALPLPRSLPAQDLAQVCRAADSAAVGQWASFNLTGGRSEGTMRFAVVGSERAADTTLYWFEMSFTSVRESGHNAVVQILVPGVGARATSVHGMIMKVGGQPAMRFSAQMVRMMGDRLSSDNAALEMARRCSSAQVVGWESVTVPAGTLRALHIKTADGDDAWTSRDVPFGLVKVHAKDGTEIILTGRGADAKSSITEQPQEFSLPGLKP